MEQLDMRKKITIMAAIMSVLLFSALNMTIVGTALPKIVAKIGGISYFDWVFTIYMLTSSITAILVGKLSDIYGRKYFILSGIIIFSLGSLLSGFSETIMQLIIYRGIQGLGGGMLMSISFATVGDLFPPRERGRWQGVLGGVFGIASLIGPTLGGYIVDHFHWSWVFWVFLPFGVLAFICILLLYPRAVQKEKEKIDYAGSFVLSVFIVTLLLAFSWADTKYAWGSWEIISLFTVSAAALALFIYIEGKVQSPVVPLYLFKNSVFTISNLVSLLLGMGMFSVIMYVPFFVQGVLGKSATLSGALEMAMTIAMVVSSGIAGHLITKTGKYKVLAIVGLAIMTMGIFLNTQLSPASTITNVIVNLVVIGLGLGVTFPVFNLTVQNAVSHKFLGVATATGQLFRELGGTIGVAVMGSILGTLMAGKLSRANLPQAPAGGEVEGLQNPQVLMDPDKLAALRSAVPEQALPVFEQVVDALRDALSYAVNGVFLFSAIVVALATITTFFLKELPLRTTNQEEEETESV